MHKIYKPTSLPGLSQSSHKEHVPQGSLRCNTSLLLAMLGSHKVFPLHCFLNPLSSCYQHFLSPFISITVSSSERIYPNINVSSSALSSISSPSVRCSTSLESTVLKNPRQVLQNTPGQEFSFCILATGGLCSIFSDISIGIGSFGRSSLCVSGGLARSPPFPNLLLRASCRN